MKRIFLVTIFILFLWSWAHVAYAGFGITPPYVRSERLTQGSEYRQQITLVRGDPVEDLRAEISVNVPGIDTWFSVDKGNEFILPAGESQVKMVVIVNVPEDAPFENYTGNIRIRTSSLETSGSGVSIALGAQVDVDITVVDQILDFEVRRVQIGEAEEGHSLWWLDFPGKIPFTMDIENTGNAPVSPTRVQFEIFDRKGIKLMESTENSNEIEKIPAFEQRSVSATIPTHLPPGGYLVRYTVYNNDEQKRSGELTLSILPRGTVADYQGYGFAGLSFADKASLFTPLGILAIGGALSSIRVPGKKKKKTRRVQKTAKSEPQRRPERRTTTRSASVAPRRREVVDLKSRKKR